MHVSVALFSFLTIAVPQPSHRPSQLSEVFLVSFTRTIVIIFHPFVIINNIIPQAALDSAVEKAAETLDDDVIAGAAEASDSAHFFVFSLTPPLSLSLSLSLSLLYSFLTLPFHSPLPSKEPDAPFTATEPVDDATALDSSRKLQQCPIDTRLKVG